MSSFPSARSVLSVDVGGTKVVVARVEARADGLAVCAPARYPSREHAGLDEILADYLHKNQFTPAAVGVGVAGPVEGRRARVTNLPWTVDAAALEASLRAPVLIMNDLEAHAHGLNDAGGADVVTLSAGIERPGNRVLIAAGTGLGQSILFFDGTRHQPSPSEGAHASFAPTTADDDELLVFLRKKYQGHVSFERAVSGLDGFRNLLDFLIASRDERPSPALARATAGLHDIGGPVIEAAGSGDPLAVRVLRWFVRLYGEETGNLALKGLALGGVYVGGGIAPRILPWLKEGSFLAGMRAKGRFETMLASMPVKVVLDPDLALKGAARRAITALG